MVFILPHHPLFGNQKKFSCMYDYTQDTNVSFSALELFSFAHDPVKKAKGLGLKMLTYLLYVSLARVTSSTVVATGKVVSMISLAVVTNFTTAHIHKLSP